MSETRKPSGTPQDSWCPTCNALPGESCRERGPNNHNRRIWTYHDPRVDVWHATVARRIKERAQLSQGRREYISPDLTLIHKSGGQA